MEYCCSTICTMPTPFQESSLKSSTENTRKIIRKECQHANDRSPRPCLNYENNWCASSHLFKEKTRWESLSSCIHHKGLHGSRVENKLNHGLFAAHGRWSTVLVRAIFLIKKDSWLRSKIQKKVIYNGFWIFCSWKPSIFLCWHLSCDLSYCFATLESSMNNPNTNLRVRFLRTDLYFSACCIQEI